MPTVAATQCFRDWHALRNRVQVPERAPGSGPRFTTESFIMIIICGAICVFIVGMVMASGEPVRS